jgi:hypothetical protein
MSAPVKDFAVGEIGGARAEPAMAATEPPLAQEIVGFTTMRTRSNILETCWV